MHKSVFAGLVLAGLDPVWVRPDIDADTGLPLRVPAERVRDALDRRPDVRAVFLVEPSYVGVLSDVGAIAELAHGRGIPLVVDQAWGAHYGFHPELPPSTLALGADGMVTSAHKTLASFTQGAYVFARAGLLDLERLGEAFEALHTTSPSGALLASLDYARWVMAQRGEELLGKTIELAGAARAALGEIEGLRILDGDDPTKLVFALGGTGADGLAVEADLFAQGVRFELANRDTIVAVFTIGDTAASAERLVELLGRSIERHRGDPRGPGAATAVWSVEPRSASLPARRSSLRARPCPRRPRTDGSPPRWSSRIRRASRRSPPARSCAPHSSRPYKRPPPRERGSRTAPIRSSRRSRSSLALTVTRQARHPSPGTPMCSTPRFSA